jgi:hypothetical protein
MMTCKHCDSPERHYLPVHNGLIGPHPACRGAVIALVGQDSEVGDIIEEYKCGFRVEQGMREKNLGKRMRVERTHIVPLGVKPRSGESRKKWLQLTQWQAPSIYARKMHGKF